MIKKPQQAFAVNFGFRIRRKIKSEYPYGRKHFYLYICEILDTK
jgi:hypothetical protein